jgi:integrase
MSDAAPRIPLPPKPRPRDRHLSAEEARRLINESKMPHVRLYLLLALHTAGRPSSILDLTWDRVDFERGIIRLDNPARDRTAKGRATIPLSPAIEPALRVAKAAALARYVIEWNGQKVESIKGAVKRTARRAMIDGVTPYVLRHWMAEAGVPMTEIAQYMGHNSTVVTERTYARFSPDYLRKAASAISERLKRLTGSTKPVSTARFGVFGGKSGGKGGGRYWT